MEDVLRTAGATLEVLYVGHSRKITGRQAFVIMDYRPGQRHLFKRRMYLGRRMCTANEGAEVSQGISSYYTKQVRRFIRTIQQSETTTRALTVSSVR